MAEDFDAYIRRADYWNYPPPIPVPDWLDSWGVILGPYPLFTGQPTTDRMDLDIVIEGHEIGIDSFAGRPFGFHIPAALPRQPYEDLAAKAFDLAAAWAETASPEDLEGYRQAWVAEKLPLLRQDLDFYCRVGPGSDKDKYLRSLAYVEEQIELGEKVAAVLAFPFGSNERDMAQAFLDAGVLSAEQITLTVRATTA